MSRDRKASAIVYTSNTGHTKQYAQLLADRLGIPAYELKEASGMVPEKAAIIYMGWLKAGKVVGYSNAKNRFDVRALCGVGMTRSGTQCDDVRKSNGLSPDMPVFTLQGGLEIEKMRGLNRFMMNFMKRIVKKQLINKKDRTTEEEETLQLILNDRNMVSAGELAAVLDWYAELKE